MCQQIFQIGFRDPARVLAGGGPGIPGKTIRKIPVGTVVGLSPESVNTPSKFGVPYSARFQGGGVSWSSQEMFSHVKTRGFGKGIEVI